MKFRGRTRPFVSPEEHRVLGELLELGTISYADVVRRGSGYMDACRRLHRKNKLVLLRFPCVRFKLNLGRTF